jgi:hydroxymethylglutaryl-CoA lyase
MAELVTVFEVGPRDGLQSLEAVVPTELKVALINALSNAGFRKIEATSFVSSRWVPQMSDASDVMANIKRNPRTAYAALTPNTQGLSKAVSARCDEIAIFASSSEGFSQANLNCSIEESFGRFVPIIKQANTIALPVRGYLSTVIACPFDGPTVPERVLEYAKRLLDLGCYEVSLGDTIGVGTPDALTALLDILLPLIPVERLAGHFHDTHGQAKELVATALKRGLRTFDASIAGLGGCPYAAGATGNVSTRDVLAVISGLNFTHGIDMQKLCDAEIIANNIIDNT